MTRWWQQVTVTYYRWILAGSLLLLVGVGWYAAGLFGSLTTEEGMFTQDTPASIVQDKIDNKFGVSLASQVVLFERKDATLGEAFSAAYQQEVARILQPLRESAESVHTYADQPSEAFISRDKMATYATVTIKGTNRETYDRLQNFADHADQSKLTLSIGGPAASMIETSSSAEQQLVRTEMMSLPILLVLLLFFFRSIVAALVPIVMSLVTIIGAFAITRFIAQFVAIDSYAVNVVTVLGLGLSIDYALLSVNRFREELKKSNAEKATRVIIATSGRTILFSGITVIACMMALLVFPVEMLHSIAIGGASAVGMAVLFTVFILPALLRLIGTRIDRWRLPWIASLHAPSRVSLWQRIVDAVMKRPLMYLALGIILVVVSSWPLIQMKTGNMDEAWLARDSSSRHVASALADDFIVPSPNATAIIELPKGLSARERIDVSCDMTKKMQDVAGVKRVVSATPVSDTVSCDALQQSYEAQLLPPQVQQLIQTMMRDDALKFDVLFEGENNTTEARDTLAALRRLAPMKGEYHIGGSQAAIDDMNKLYGDAMLPAALIVVMSMIILLALSLRSIVIPIQAIIINSISLGVSLAVIVGVFQLGWLHTLTGWSQTGAIALAAPVLVIAIAFGLAMDYSVFLYSRMREVYDATGDPKEAIRQGVVKTGPIITAAALALFVVVAAFAGSSVMFMQIVGVGLATAVLVDAFFVRLILVPSVMALMGRASWYSPKWLAKWHIKHD